MELVDRLRAWTYRRQGLGQTAPSALAALEAAVAVYSSHPSGPLTLWARTDGLTPDAFNQLERGKQAVRIHAMRNSVFLLPSDWAPRIYAALPLADAVKGQRLKYAEISAADYEALKPILIERAATPVALSELAALVPKPANSAVVVHLLCREALMLRLGRGSVRSDDLEYVAAEPWLRRSILGGDTDGALAWLADRYLRGYGPARVDFAWWAGLPKGKARVALATAVDVGSGYLLPDDLTSGYEAVTPLDEDALDLIPKWDAYTMAYAPDGRQRLIPTEHLKLAYTQAGGAATAGDGLPLVLLGGRAVGSWAHRLDGKRLVATVKPFPGEPQPPESRIAERIEAIGKFLGVERVSLKSD